jgi:hypothetical protein
LPIGVGIVLYLAVLLQLLAQRSRTASADLPLPALIGAAFLVLAVLTTVWASGDAFQWLYGLRQYVAMGSLFFALALLPLPQDLLRRLWVAVGVVVLIQLPAVLYQYVFVAGRRVTQSLNAPAWDAIVGTMGGSQDGGGQSAAMGFFVVAGFALVFAKWKYGLVRTWAMAAFTAVVLAIIFLAEVKFMVVLLPVAVALIVRTQLLRHAKAVAAGIGVVVVLAAAMPVLYSKLHYERSGRAPVGVAEFYQKMLDNSDADHVNENIGTMGRVTQLVFWWNQHDLLEQPKEVLIGHGIASTNVAKLGAGAVARQYFPLEVSNTAGVIMLWEVGIVGLGLSMAVVAWLAVRSFRLSASTDVPISHRALLEAGGAVLLMLLPSLFYKHFPLKSPAVQFVIFLAAGQVCYWHAQLASSRVRKARRAEWQRPVAPVPAGGRQ